MSKKYIATVGMEAHIELRTVSKMFCGCPSDHFAKPPNSQTCPVCLGLPGALPSINKKAIEWTIMIALALKCKISELSKFDRKHYFYPDLPKGYQISQYDEPIGIDGFLETSYGRVGIERVHIEEDTGKLQHKEINGRKITLIDFNRSGVPLVEIVTHPDIHSGLQAKEYCQKLQQIIRTLKVSDCDMEKGSMRLEANVSWGLDWGYKVEVKNLNSFRFVDKAIEYELKRQKEILEKGIIPKQETRGWDEVKNVTVSQRYKETAADYRYFPEPDLPPMKFNHEFIRKLKSNIPELPEDKRKRFIEKYGLRKDYADIIVSNQKLAEVAEKIFIQSKKESLDINNIASILINRKDIKNLNKDEIIKLYKLKKEKITDEDRLSEWVKEAMNLMPKAIDDFKKGKTNSIMALVGKVVQLSKGKADPIITKKILEQRLK